MTRRHRAGREAGRVFERLLWLSASDNQGVRFLIEPVAAGEPWERSRGT
ncbi:MAG: hypothetical protein ACE5JR_12440 [Gemmatimonadota bacterium]